MKDIWRRFEPSEVNMTSNLGAIVFHTDGTYFSESWPKKDHEMSLWSFKRGTLYVDHQDGKGWICCNQLGMADLNKRIELELAVDRALEDESETIKLRRIVTNGGNS